MTDVRRDAEGWVDMSQFPDLDPGEALPVDVDRRLHDALVAEPVHPPDDETWNALLEAGMNDPGDTADWLVPFEPSGQPFVEPSATGTSGPEPGTGSMDVDDSGRPDSFLESEDPSGIGDETWLDDAGPSG